MKIKFTSPIHRIKGLNPPPSLSFFHHKTINDMKVHIKKVLNMHIENSTIDKYISSIFNLNNVNPTYVFRLPDRKNRTLVFRKSDFTAAVFPNITNVNKFSKTNENLQASSSSKHPVKVKNEELLDELKHERFIFENNLSVNFDDYDDSMKQIVDENVRSENDFIELMNELNEDLNQEDLREKYHQRFTTQPVKVVSKKPSYGEKIKSKKKSEEEDWEELGLSGWTGVVTGSKAQLPKKLVHVLATLCSYFYRFNCRPKKIPSALAPIYHNFDPLSFLKTSRNPQNIPPRPQTSQEADIEIEELSEQLSTILLKDEESLLNKTGRVPNQKPRWPITTTRDKHGDNDVFLARANNPFGHSTKWKYK